MTLLFNRAKLEAFVDSATAHIQERDGKIQKAGRDARAAGVPMTEGMGGIGSYVRVKWLEGWTGTSCPRRTVVGGAFNMTPREELSSYIDWMAEIGLPDDQVAESIRIFKIGYTPAALGDLNG